MIPQTPKTSCARLELVVLTLAWMRRRIHRQSPAATTFTYRFRLVLLTWAMDMAISRKAVVTTAKNERLIGDKNYMSGLRMASWSLFFVLSMLFFPVGMIRANQISDLCRLKSLPADIQNQLKDNYRTWKIQGPSDLSLRARERWESEKPLACPGIAFGYFESAKSLSYAILLVPTGRPDGGYKLLIFGQKPNEAVYEVREVGSLDQNGASNYFIHRAPIGKFFDEASRKKFQAHTMDGILLVDSAENEYGVEVYFWSGGRYRYAPIDY
jgi:hypothetical protein